MLLLLSTGDAKEEAENCQMVRGYSDICGNGALFGIFGGVAVHSSGLIVFVTTILYNCTKQHQIVIINPIHEQKIPKLS